MSGKLSEVEGRIGTVHQLEAVITAMRGSAAARERRAAGSMASALMPRRSAQQSGRHLHSLPNPSSNCAKANTRKDVSSSSCAPSRASPAHSTSGFWMQLRTI
jgi:hypothetical protein